MSHVFLAHRHDASFPRAMHAVSPLVEYLEARGPLATELDGLPGRAVAIVGTRHPPPRAISFATALAACCARAGLVVVSGGARGIDMAAHRGALHVGGRTVAVLPGGIDVPFPAEHAREFAAIERSGAVVAIRPRGFIPHGPDFLHRNGVIVALAEDLVVAAAPLRSGARNTAAHARALNKRRWFVPGDVHDPTFHGSLLELEQDREARCLCRIAAIVEFRGLSRRVDPAANPDAPPVSSHRVPLPPHPPPHPLPPHPPPLPKFGGHLPAEDERRVYLALRGGAVSVDALVAATGISVGALRTVLLTWTFEGVVREGPAGVFRLANSEK